MSEGSLGAYERLECLDPGEDGVLTLGVATFAPRHRSAYPQGTRLRLLATPHLDIRYVEHDLDTGLRSVQVEER